MAAKCPQRGCGPNEQGAVRNGWGSDNRFIERVARQDFEGVAGPNDRHHALVRGEVNISAGSDWGREIAGGRPDRSS